MPSVENGKTGNSARCPEVDLCEVDRSEAERRSQRSSRRHEQRKAKKALFDEDKRLSEEANRLDADRRRKCDELHALLFDSDGTGLNGFSASFDLNEVVEFLFQARVTKLDARSNMAAMVNGFSILIDGKRVSKLQHSKACKFVVKRMSRAVEWCKVAGVDCVRILDSLESAVGRGANGNVVDIWLDIQDGDEATALESLLQEEARCKIGSTFGDFVLAVERELRQEPEGDADINTSDAVGRPRGVPMADSKRPSTFRQPKEWLQLRKQAGLSSSKNTWTNLKKKHPEEIDCLTTKFARISFALAHEWGLKLPEYNTEPESKAHK